MDNGSRQGNNVSIWDVKHLHFLWVTVEFTKIGQPSTFWLQAYECNEQYVARLFLFLEILDFEICVRSLSQAFSASLGGAVYRSPGWTIMLSPSMPSMSLIQSSLIKLSVQSSILLAISCCGLSFRSILSLFMSSCQLCAVVHFKSCLPFTLSKDF
jgi:hypothetical protein